MKSLIWFSACVVALASAFAAQSANADGVAVTVKPASVFIEARELQQLNFEFEVVNGTGQPVELRRIELAVRDQRGALSLNRDIDRSGASPAIFTVAPD